MVYNEKNENGIISISTSLFEELVHESVRAWTYTNKLKLLPVGKDRKLVTMTEKGVLIDIRLQLAMGESIELVSSSIIDFIIAEVESSLELPVDDIIVVIESMFTRKGNTVPRNLVFKYSERKESKA